jgi:hypothetical protein
MRQVGWAIHRVRGGAFNDPVPEVIFAHVVPTDLPERFLCWAMDQPFLRRLVQHKNRQEIADWLRGMMK